MPEYLDDPSSLTKDKLKSELLAHNVELPSGNPTKDVYVQLYLRNLTAQKKQHVAAATLDAFSSDEELPPPVVSNRSRSSGRKATRKTDKARPDELDVTLLSDEGLRDELLKYGVDIGPIVASTRKLYEKKLQKLLDDGPAHPPMPQAVVTENQVNHNGNSESDLYSDKEDEVPAAPEPEPVAEPEPAPVVERPVRSRGKTPISARTHSSSSQHNTRDQVMHEEDDDDLVLRVKRRSGRLFHKTIMPEDLRPVLTAQVPSNRRDSPARAETSNWSRPAQEECAPLHKERQQKISSFLSTCSPVTRRSYAHTPSKELTKVEKIAATEQTTKVEEKGVLKELFTNDIHSPTGITATCRRPIRGAAGRPVKSSDLWNDENCYFSPKITKTSSNSSSYTESRTVNRVSSLPLSTSSRLLSAVPPASQTKATRRSVSLWIKLFLLAIVAAFLFLVYQAMETNTINPFVASDTAVSSSSTA